MCPVLAPAALCRVVDQSRDDPVRATTRVGILAVKDETHNVVHLPHAHDKGADKVKTGLFAPLSCDLILGLGVVASDFGNGREKQVRAIRQPVDPLELSGGRDALERQVTGLQNNVAGHVFWKVELGSRDCGK